MPTKRKPDDLTEYGEQVKALQAETKKQVKALPSLAAHVKMVVTLIREGQFYAAYGEEAEEVGVALQLALSQTALRYKSKEQTPTAFVGVSKLEASITRLTNAGFAVGVADGGTVEDEKGKRGIVRLVMPGGL